MICKWLTQRFNNIFLYSRADSRDLQQRSKEPAAEWRVSHLSLYGLSQNRKLQEATTGLLQMYFFIKNNIHSTGKCYLSPVQLQAICQSALQCYYRISIIIIFFTQLPVYSCTHANPTIMILYLTRLSMVFIKLFLFLEKSWFKWKNSLLNHFPILTSSTAKHCTYVNTAS